MSDETGGVLVVPSFVGMVLGWEEHQRVLKAIGERCVMRWRHGAVLRHLYLNMQNIARYAD